MNIFAPLHSEFLPSLQQIEVATFFQIPSFQLIGLPGPEVSEAKERVRAAIEASGLEFPKKRVVVNLSPASIKKRGTGLDLPVALAVLVSDIQKDQRIGAWGELGLDGQVKPAGQLTRSVYSAWKEGLSYLFLSLQEYHLAQDALACIQESQELTTPAPILIPVSHLQDAWHILTTESWPEFNSASRLNRSTQTQIENLLVLEPVLERILGIVTSGLHHLLLIGPQGIGKSHALEWLSALHPRVSPQLELQQRLVSELSSGAVFTAIRRVGAQTRPDALVGKVSASSWKVGEFSLAHGGLLIADELLEWSSESRELLREPLERGKVTLTQLSRSWEFPAQFILAASSNLCPCGGWPTRRCQCLAKAKREYYSRLSGPILDRIDLVAMLGEEFPEILDHQPVKTQFLRLEEKILSCRDRLIENWGKIPGLLSAVEVEEILQKNLEWKKELELLTWSSLRSRHKIIRLVLTLAEWDGCKKPLPAHFQEAIRYRADHLLIK